MSAEDLLRAEVAPLCAALQRDLGPGLRALWLFGSYLSPALRRPSSVPDVFALVEDSADAARRLGLGPLRRWLCRVLPPLVLPYAAGDTTRSSTGAGARAAKLNLATAAQIGAALRGLPDLYLAGRLSKRVLVLYARDVACAGEVESLLSEARAAMLALALQAQGAAPPPLLYQRALALSYEGELRPESAARLRLLYQCDAASYDALFAPLLQRLAASQGQLAIPQREPWRRVVRRSRRRFLLRMARQALVYRGWWAYLRGKLRRAANR